MTTLESEEEESFFQATPLWDLVWPSLGADQFPFTLLAVKSGWMTLFEVVSVSLVSSELTFHSAKLVTWLSLA